MQYMNRRAPLSAAEKAEKEREREAREAEIRMKNNRLGITLFQWSWIMVFVCLVVVYWQLGFSQGWRPAPEQAPNPILPTVATIGLIASAFFARIAWRHLKQLAPQQAQDRAPFKRFWLIAIVLGAGFFLIMMAQYFSLPADVETARFGIIYRLMIGYHAIHAVVIGLMMLQILRLSGDGRYHSANHWPVEATVRLWDFVVVAWLLFFAVLYAPFLL